jgi:type VI secretion system protein ImpL
MLKKDVFRIVLYAIGLLALGLLVWYAGPLLRIQNSNPLDDDFVRGTAIGLMVFGAVAYIAFEFYLAFKRKQQLSRGISEQEKVASDEGVLKDRMTDALATLKAASKKADFLYELPWYVLIGPPGSGKTTALVNSGLKFPLASGTTPAAIAGVGGTRYCDWWFTEDAVLIDTAGRYTTQDSDAKADKQSWLAFLDLLKKNRPRQPINGVMVAISLEDIMTLSKDEIAAHADAIRSRLIELHERLGVDFPVYALFTKADLVSGFVEFFDFLNEDGRRQVWGATFQTDDKKLNLVGEIPAEFDALLERITGRQLDRLQDEPAPDMRVTLFGFPAQMARLRQHLFAFVNQIFDPRRYTADAPLRGFYFTSGTQQGTPIDQLIGTLAASFGSHISASDYSGRGRSYFLTDLVQKVIIGESAWVLTDPQTVRRKRFFKAAGLAACAIVTIGLAFAWYVSYARNNDLIRQTNAVTQDYASRNNALLKQNVIADRELHTVLPVLDELRTLPAGYATRGTAVPIPARLGLSQRERLQSSSENAYRVGLERMLRPRLIYRIEERLAASIAAHDRAAVDETLKIYMMIGGVQAADRALITRWMRQDWADNLYKGPANAAGRRQLEDHLTAMLDLEAGQEPLFDLDGALIEQAQKTLAGLS